MLSQQKSHSTNACVKTILVLAANPKSTSRLQLDEEVREIDEGLRRSSKREQFRLEQKWAVRQRDFYRAILDYQPQIVHFSGHGTGVDGIVLEDETEQLVELNALALASMFKLFATKGVECVLLNACYSEVQAKAISQHVKYVIGMNKTIGDKASIAFSVAFYDALAAGEQMEFAYELGCSVLINYLAQQTPVLYKKDETNFKNEKNIISVQLKEDIIPPNPYQGLAAFGEEDAAFFFGRETFVNGLIEAVNKQPLVAVIGSSGSGKSSCVYAGLIPQLRVTDNWVIESFRPGNQPFYQLASALVRQLVTGVDEIQQMRSAAGLAKNIQQGSVTLQQITSRIRERNPDKRLLLFVDQFEELYTLCQKEEQERFADVILQAIQEKSITLVFTLRADFYGFVLAYRPFRDALQPFTPQLLSAMNREELQRAIEQPAQRIEVQLEEQLTQRILDDVGNEPGNLPLLEFAMTRLWSLQQNRTLTHQAYQEIGGVKKALANHAEHVYQNLSSTEQKAAPHIFLQLVRPGEGTEDTRRIATRAEVGDENWGLVSYLAGYKARLVVTGHDEKSGEDIVEVVHEALIREWLTLREWMKKDRLFRAWQERLRAIIYQWEESSRDEGALLRGVPLSEAEEKLKQRREELSPSEQDFIQQSLLLRERLRREEKARRRKEIAGVSVAVLAVVVTLGLTTFYQSRQANINSAKGKYYSQAFIDLKNGNEQGSLRQFKKALRLDPNDPQVYYNLGFTYYKLSDYDRAMADYNQAIKLDPNDASTYNNRGNVYSYKKHYDRAIADYNRAIADYNQALKIEPNYANAYYNRGNAYSYKKDYDRAIADYNQALKIDPNFAKAYNGRGNAYSYKKDYDRAIADYNQTLKIDPNYANAYYGRGNVYKNQGNKDKAVGDFNKFLELSNDVEWKQNAKEQLQELGTK